MDIDPELAKQLAEVFQGELDEQLQVLTDGLLRLEKGLEQEARQSELEHMFRAAHNIKGAARGVDVRDLAELAHDLESLFAAFKQHDGAPSAEVIDLCLGTLDAMRRAMEAHNSSVPTPFDLPALQQRLADAIQMAGGLGEEQSAEPGIAALPARTRRVQEACSGRQLNDDGAGVAEDAKSASAGSSTPSPAPETIRLPLDKVDSVAAIAEELQVAKIELEDQFSALQSLRARLQAFNLHWGQLARAVRTQADPSLRTDVGRAMESGSVLLKDLDALSNAMQKGMRSSTGQLGLLSNALLSDIHLMRLVPASTVLRPLVRSVRDIARELNKQVAFTIVGDDIEVDRAVLEGIRDPMMHLLRNAIDHGIESAAERQARGKPAAGNLTARVERRGAQIVINIEDDGNGIDFAEIGATAVRKRIISETELAQLDRSEVLDLIFRPGLSSKEIVTNVSGRGVGLDVVRANLRKLKGSVQVDTRPGEGTRFELSLPLTLATDHGLQVRVGGSVFAIPTASIERVMELPHSAVFDVEGAQAVLMGSRTVPLRALEAVLEMEVQRHQAGASLPVVVVSKGWDCVAFVVDEIVGEREIIVKPLMPPLRSVRNVTGGTLTGSGELMIVLNPNDLVDSALGQGIQTRVLTDSGAVRAGEGPRILVVDDSITTRNLEKGILENAGYDVGVAVDGRSAWDLLQAQDFDLVVTDIEMPTMDGFELTARIKDSDRLSTIPVIIVSSLAKEADRRKGIEVGADAYIVKGQFETKALLDMIRQLV